jgi:plastocyanin
LSGRFQVEATWQTASGTNGSGHAANLTLESGYFWFFDPSNVELIVKALDACGIGSGQWFFSAGMTTVGVQLTVTDTFTGLVKIYGPTAVGVAFVPILDTTAFSSCQSRPPQAYTVVLAAASHQCRSALGEVANVGFEFSPSEVHIHVGDSVSWTSGSGTHSIPSGIPNSPDGRWDSLVLTGPFTYSHTFLQPGTFAYYCAPGHSIYEVVLGGDRPGACGFASHSHEPGTVIVDP